MRRPSTSTVISIVALFFALAGSAVAAKHYLITSTSQIKPSVLSKLRGKAGPAGAMGPQGPAGPAGTPVLGALVRVVGPEVTVPTEEVGSSTATCPAGDHIVSGGYQSVGPNAHIFASDSFGGQSWSALQSNFEAILSAHVQAIAFCAPAGVAVASSARERKIVTARINAALEAERLAHRH